MAVLTLSTMTACTALTEKSNTANSESKKVVTAEATAGQSSTVAQSNTTDSIHGTDQSVSTPLRLIGLARQQIKVNDEMTRQINAFLNQASSQGTLIITGYCNKDHLEQAKETAISRAALVRKMAVDRGIDIKKIRIYYITNTTYHGVELDWK